jgi:vancomycin permeability regulator SanA
MDYQFERFNPRDLKVDFTCQRHPSKKQRKQFRNRIRELAAEVQVTYDYYVQEFL